MRLVGVELFIGGIAVFIRLAVGLPRFIVAAEDTNELMSFFLFACLLIDLETPSPCGLLFASNC
jgi:hypothetical protein